MLAIIGLPAQRNVTLHDLKCLETSAKDITFLRHWVWAAKALQDAVDLGNAGCIKAYLVNYDLPWQSIHFTRNLVAAASLQLVGSMKSNVFTNLSTTRSS